MRLWTALLPLILAAAAALTRAQEPPPPPIPEPEPATTAPAPAPTVMDPFPAGYLDHAALTDQLEKLAAAQPDRIHLRSLTRTIQGRDVWLVSVGDRQAASPRPALLLVANAEADHVIGSQVALGLLESLATKLQGSGDDARWLDAVTLYIVPRLNPDGAEALLTPPHAPLRTNLRPTDRDRDADAGEDGPDDLDLDGQITTLRARDRHASLRPDPNDPRISLPAENGHAPVFSEYVEGLDNDADGSLNEDPPGGVNLNRNAPHLWPEFQPEAGPTPFSEPETRALAQFAFDHPEIVAVWTFSLHDSLRDEPKKPAAPYDNADMPLFLDLHRSYQSALASGPDALDVPGPAATGAPTTAAETLPPADAPLARAPIQAASPPPLDEKGSYEGSLAAWAYHQLGTVALSSRLWTGPHFPRAEPAAAEGATPPPTPPESGEARWLYWNDRALGGQGFQPFRPFDHPTLGPVVIGGWKPGVRLNPPAPHFQSLTATHAAFLADLVSRFPRLEVPIAQATPLQGGLIAVEAVVQNTGQWPTATAQGVNTGFAPPVLVRLDPGEAGRILAGPPLDRIDSLPGHASNRRSLRWVVAPGQSPLRLEVTCPKAGSVSREIPLP